MWFEDEPGGSWWACDIPGTDEGGEWSSVHEAWSRSGSWQASKWEGGMNESNLHRNERDPKTI